MLRPLAVFAACLSATALAQPPADTPKPPDGWKRVEAKDKSCSFLVPAKPKRVQAVTQDVTLPGLSTKQFVTEVVTADGLTLTVQSVAVSGTQASKLKAAEMHKLLRSSPETVLDDQPAKLAAAGKAPVRDCLIDDGPAGTRRVRTVLFTRSRVYALTVLGADKAAVTGPAADTFLDSLLPTPEKAAAVAKESAAKQKETDEKAAAGDENTPPWVFDLTKLGATPDKPAFGKLLGQPFVATRAELRHNRLILFAGPGGVFDTPHLDITLPHTEAPLAGKTLTVGPKLPIFYSVSLGRPTKARPLPVSAPDAVVRLEFGPLADGKVAGKLYVCCSDPGRSVVAGTFEASGK